MNIFCHPEVMNGGEVRVMLGIESSATPEFGFRPRTPLLGNRYDNTEIDMTVGELMVEGKLTESDFQRAKASLISRYRDLSFKVRVPEIMLLSTDNVHNLESKFEMTAFIAEDPIRIGRQAVQKSLGS
jgi:hypothetical protein